MEFLQNNWVWILVIVFFVLMHVSGMGCGGHRRHAPERADEKKNKDQAAHGGCH